jgi:hypothetical protein
MIGTVDKKVDVIRSRSDPKQPAQAAKKQPSGNRYTHGAALQSTLNDIAKSSEMDNHMAQPILERASASRPSGEWGEDDYDVLGDGAVVGRIMRARRRARRNSAISDHVVVVIVPLACWASG